MQRVADGKFSVSVRGFPLILYTGGCLYDLSERDLWFVLLGELHQDPVRFISEAEILKEFVHLFGPLQGDERQTYSSANPAWGKLRKRNKESVAPGRVETLSFRIASTRELQAERKAAYVRGVKNTKKVAQLRVTSALCKSLPMVGKEAVRRIASDMNFEASNDGAQARRRYSVFYGSFRLGCLTNESYQKEMTTRAAASPYKVHPIPSGDAVILMGSKINRDVLVTLYNIPEGVEEVDVREALRGVDVACTQVELARIHRKTSTCSWRVVASTEQDAETLMNAVIAFEDRSGRAIAARHYHHRKDFDAFKGGAVSDLNELVQCLASGPAYHVGQSALVVWEDGLHASGQHFVSGLTCVAGSRRGSISRIFDFVGSDSDSNIMALSLSLLSANCGHGKHFQTVVFVWDHLMAFNRLGVRVGNQGLRNPFVEIWSEEQALIFVSERMRTAESLLDNALAFLRCCRDLSRHVADISDLRPSVAAKFARFLKRSSICKGVTDCPAPLRFTLHDHWTHHANFHALQVWQRLVKWHPPSTAGDRFVVINMRDALPLRGDFRADFSSFVPAGASLDVKTKDGHVVELDAQNVTVHPLQHYSFLFVRHSLRVDPTRILFMPPSLHCALHLVVLGMELLTRTLVSSGGTVLGQDTSEMTRTELQALVDQVKGMLLGRLGPVHSYTSLMSFTPIFSLWMRHLGPITHRAFVQVPTLMASFLRTRVCNDHSLRSDGDRYELYIMALMFVPLILTVEVAECARRRSASRACLNKYLAIRGFEQVGSIVLPVVSAGAPEIISLLGDDNVETAESALDNDLADDREIEERAGEAKGKARAGNKYRKFGAIYIGSLLALGPSLLKICSQTQQRHLLADFGEDHFEARLKPFSAMVREGNGRQHLGEFGALIDIALRGTQESSLAAGSHQWLGEGVKSIIVGSCWISGMPLGAHNIRNAIFSLLTFSRSFFRWICVRTEGMMFKVGVDGEVIVLCACGNEDHPATLRECFSTAPSLHQAVGNGASMDTICSHLRNALPLISRPERPRGDIAAELDVVAKSVLRAQRQRENREEAELNEQHVSELLFELRFKEDANVPATTDELDAFFAEQWHGKWATQRWPKSRNAQVAHLAKRLDEEWHSKREATDGL